jgi:hypothetical protein
LREEETAAWLLNQAKDALKIKEVAYKDFFTMLVIGEAFFTNGTGY